MQVPLLDLKPQHEALRKELRAATDRVLDSQQFVLGEEVRLLETEIARYCGTRHAIGCASGSDALLLALMALSIGAGDEVITTPFSFFATASAIARTNATPVFVDIEPHTYNLDPSLVEAAITERTRAIMPVHLYGQCARMDALSEVAARHKLPVIEDAAQAIGAEDDTRRRAGSIGRVGCFSFYPTKNLGAAGDAGILTTDDDALDARLRRLRVHGGATEYLHQEIGINSRLDALQAAILRVKLPHLDNWSDARRERAETYARMLTDAHLAFPLHVPFVRENTRHIFHQYVVRVPEHRDALIEHLRAHGVGVKIYYPVPLHLQECFAYLGYAAGALPVAERAARETLALPLYPELRLEQQQYVVDIISRFRP
jgi:dTDP-4-amino-4,6-dideoxygalactose transaminase